MSDEIIRGRVEADVSGYRRGMQEAARSTDEFRRQAETGSRGLGTLGQMVGSVVRSLPSLALGAGGAAAAALTLARQVHSAADELGAFNKVLILSGHAAGVSAGAMTEMAAAIDAAHRGITRGDAAAALQAMAASGAAVTGDLRAMTEAALEFEASGGAAVEEVAKNFASLADAPLKAVVKLNESMNFLTVDTYKQVKALEEAGDKTGAARVAFELYEKAIRERSADLNNNLSNIDWLWQNIRDSAREAADAAIGFFRASTNGENLEKLRKQRAGLQEALDARNGWGMGEGGPQRALLQGRIQALTDEIKLLERGAQAENDHATARRDNARAVAAVVEADKKEEKSKAGSVRALRATRQAAVETTDAIERLLLRVDEQAMADAEKALQDYNAAWADLLNGLDEQARGLEEQVALYGMTEAQIAAVNLQRAEERLEIAKTNGVADDYLEALAREVELRRQIASSSRTLQGREDAARAQEQAAREWEKITDDVGEALTEAIFTGGKDGWELLRRTIESTVIRAVVQPVVTGAVQSGLSSIGLGGGAGGGGGMPNIPGSGSLVSSGITALGASLGYGTAAGSFLGSLGAGMGTFGSLSAGAGAMSAGAASASAGAYASAAGYYIGTVAPYLLAALVVADALGAFKGPTYHSGSAVLTGTNDISTRLGHKAAVPGMPGGVWGGFSETDAKGGAAYTSALSSLGKAMTDSYEQTLAAFGVNAMASAYTAFGADGDDASEGNFRLWDENGNVIAQNYKGRQGKHYAKDAAKGLEQYAQDAALLTTRAIVTRLRDTDLEDALDAIFDAVDPAKASLEALNAALQAAQAWMAQGEQLRAAISEMFDSPMERLQARFEDLGLAVPATVEAYEALVRAQNLSTTSGRAAAIGLMEARSLWDEATQAAKTAAETARDAMQEAAQTLRETIAQLRGSTAGAGVASLRSQYDMAYSMALATSGTARAGYAEKMAELLPDLVASMRDEARSRIEWQRETAKMLAKGERVASIMGFADGGAFGGGLRIVGEAGPELEATGPARIWSAQQTRALLGGGADVAAEVRALRDENRSQAAAMVQMQARLARLMERWDGNGMPETRVTA